jgi:hypothetical protein
MQHKSQNIFLNNQGGSLGTKTTNLDIDIHQLLPIKMFFVFFFRSLKFDIGGFFVFFFSFLSTITSTFHVQNHKVRHT